jgi:hypothetical protein
MPLQGKRESKLSQRERQEAVANKRNIKHEKMSKQPSLLHNAKSGKTIVPTELVEKRA